MPDPALFAPLPSRSPSRSPAIAGMLMAALVALGAMGPALPAHAQAGGAEARSVEQIVEALVVSAGLGPARAVCIGTPQDCAEGPQAGLDMRVGFDFDSDRLSAQAQEALAVFVLALDDSRLAALHFRVEGHTDAFGTETYNLDLSQRRAAAVHGFLVAQGIGAARLDSVGLGQSRPRLPDPFDGANRRVELRAFQP